MAGMVPEDVYELTGVTDPRVSPDGATVVYVVIGVDEKANRYRGAIWLAALDGQTEPRQFTSGAKSDAEPRWSPDGSALAFTSNRDGDTMQLYVVPVAGGEARKLTALKEDVTQPVWSPDGTRLAFVARVPDPAYDEKDDKRRSPRRFTRLQYKLDDVGWTADRPQHLFTVRADGSERAGPAHRRRLRGLCAGVVAGRSDLGVRLGPAPRLGPRDGQRHLPGRGRRRRAAPPHPGRRLVRARLVGARRRPPCRDAAAQASTTTRGTCRSPWSTPRAATCAC